MQIIEKWLSVEAHSNLLLYIIIVFHYLHSTIKQKPLYCMVWTFSRSAFVPYNDWCPLQMQYPLHCAMEICSFNWAGQSTINETKWSEVE